MDAGGRWNRRPPRSSRASITARGAHYARAGYRHQYPETKHSTKGAELFGQEAMETNRRLVATKTMKLELDVETWENTGAGSPMSTSATR